MILIAGADDPVLGRIAAALEAAGRPHERVERLDADAVWRRRAGTLVLVEPLPRAGGEAAPADGTGPGDGDRHGDPLDDLLGAAAAPGVERIVVVTGRAADDEGLARVRRSGAPYLIVRAAPLLDLDELCAAVRGRRVLVPEASGEVLAGAVSIDRLVEEVLGAVADEEAVGRTVIAPAAGAEWLRLIEEAGARPVVVGPLRARLGGWLGRPIVRVDAGRIAVRPAS